MATMGAEEYAQWCQDRGVGVEVSSYGDRLVWASKDPADLKRMHLLMFGGQPAWAVRRRPDWPEQQRIPVPIEFDSGEAAAYAAGWEQFSTTMRELDSARVRLERARVSGSASQQRKVGQELTQLRAKELGAVIRYRQKAGLIKAAHTADFAAEMVAKGKQVAVSCEFLGTVDAVVDRLRAAHRIEAATFTGENREEREGARVAFQRGVHQVIVFTPTEGFSLHAGERSVDGNDTDRVTVIAEPRWSPKKALQVEGRAHRDGRSAACYYMFATGTVEERVLGVVIAGMSSTMQLMGESALPVQGLADALGLPLTV